MTFGSLKNWDEFFSLHLQLVKKIEEQLEFGDEKEQQEALFAYKVMKEQVKSSMDGVLKASGKGEQEMQKMVQKEGKDALDSEQEKRIIEFEKSLRRTKQLIRKRLRKNK